MMHWEWGADFAHIIMNERKKEVFGDLGRGGGGVLSSMGVGFLGFVNPTSMPNSRVSRVLHPRDLWLFFFFLNNFF
jgi:hypothetical protein